MQRVVSLPKLPDRPPQGHKGLFGRVLVVGGSEGMIGAPVFAATAALRCGAGLVQIAVPGSILTAALTITPELIGLGLGKSVRNAALISAAEKADAIVLGPGLGQSAEARARVRQLVRLRKPMVIDADALNILAAARAWPAAFKAAAVLTPHSGEMKRLATLFGRSEIPADERRRVDFAGLASKKLGQVLILKGHRTIVTDGQRVFMNHTGDSSLSKAGTGDVLSGVLGCLLAQKMDRFEASVIAVNLHGRAGETAGARLGRRCVLASDVVAALPEAIRAYEREVG